MTDVHLHLAPKKPGVWLFGFRSLLVLSAFTLFTGAAGAVFAQTPPKPNKWIVTITDSPDPVPSGGTLTYKIASKNDGPTKSTDVKVTIDLPASVQFVSCKTSNDKKGQPSYCLGIINGQVIARLPEVRAHRKPIVTVVVTVPNASATTQLLIAAKTEGENAFKGDDTEQTTLLAPGTTATLFPSGRTVAILCGRVLDGSFFGADNIMQLNAPLGCTTSTLFGLKIAQSGVTLNLQGNKIIASGNIAGNAGIVIGSGATSVTVDGGGVNGTNGIETFDWCVKDEGGNNGLILKNLRCYRARSAAIKIVSNNVEVSNAKIDNTSPTSTTTQELPGGVGIYSRGDDVRIKDTIVRRSKLIGILADGADANVNGQTTTIDGNTTTSRVEDSFGVGVRFQNGPHLLKDTAVYGDGPGVGTSTDGVVVDTGTGNRLDGVVVKKFNNHGIVINASNTRVDRTGVEEVSQNGFVISALATNVTLNGNSSAQLSGSGFVVDGGGNILTTNSAERNAGNGFQINGNGNRLANSSAQLNDGIGFVVSGSSNSCGTNRAEDNGSFEWSIGVNNINDGSNSANGHSISFGAAGGTFE